jgi:phospholipid transport system substrate-binding protein
MCAGLPYRRLLALILAAVLLGFTPARADGEMESDSVPAAETFIHEFIAGGVAALRDDSLSPAERDGIFHRFILDSFDSDFAGRFALGRGWNIASAKQRKEYLDLFRADMLRVGNRLFRGYRDETLEVLRIIRLANGKLSVETRLTNPRSAVRDIDFRLRSDDGSFRIIDVRLEGFSMLSSYRAEITGRLLQGGVEGVLEMLRRRNALRVGSVQ